MSRHFVIPKNQLHFLLFILAAVLLIIWMIFSAAPAHKKIKASDGVIDLKENKVTNEGLPLNGTWAFYWKKLYAPQQPDNFLTQKPDVFINVPGIWNGTTIAGAKIPAEGFATYSLLVKNADSAQIYALNLRTMSNAYRLWVDGKLLAENGKVGAKKTETVPAYKPQIVVFKPTRPDFRIVVQVANFYHCKGGFWLSADLGTLATVQRERDNRVLLEMFLFGSLFIMALYHFSLYFLRRLDKTVLFFGLMCLIICIRSLFTGENLINNILPDLDWFVARKTEYILTFVSAPIYATFSHTLYPREWNRWIYRIVTSFGLLLALFVLVTPSSVFTYTSYVFTGYAWLTSMYTIGIFSRAALHKKEGAGIFLVTSLVFLLTIVNDTLNQLEIIHTGLYLSLGLFIVTFAQSFSLSSRFANAFRNTEIYANTFRKFVPVQFLDKIAKDGIGSIKPGNAETLIATLLFSDIRSFTSISEKLKPDEVFAMLNQYLAYVEPPIRNNGGFVDKYMGDGIMALFENTTQQHSAENAIRAALEMQVKLREFNKTRITGNAAPLIMGIGLHTGPVIIGTVGGTERMDSTAIGDAVNLASRIEGMTKIYGVPLLASHETISQPGISDLFVMRFIDFVAAKGKNEPVEIWEVIGMQADREAQLYAATLITYNEALAEFRAQNFTAAKVLFEKVLHTTPGDTTSQLYVRRCKTFIENGGTGSSDMFFRLDEK